MTNIFIELKKTCLGILDRGDCDKNNETYLKEGGGTEMSTTVLPIRDARSLSLCILLTDFCTRRRLHPSDDGTTLM